MMQRLYFDTNVMLDFFMMRELFWMPIARIVSFAEKKKVTVVVSPISFATVSYLLEKIESQNRVLEKLRNFRILCEVSSTNGQTIDKALNSEFSDFEDALQYFCAIESKCDIIITRNGKDFKESILPVMNANEYLKSL